MSVQSGSHLAYRPDPRMRLDYAVADLLLTRGDGAINEIEFANEVARGVLDEGLQGYVVEKLRHLALTEYGDVKTSACRLLWVYTVDLVDDSVHRDAGNALRDADCRCKTKPDGNVECR
jgi:hypothetical protein